MGESALEAVKYPNETLHEIITNAVIHRDYSIADDVHIRIFDNRVEIQSPGKLPAHVTPQNILKERFARNGAVTRTLNKFPDPPNKDVGEGLNTAFQAMESLGLKAPIIAQDDNNVIVTIRHEPLASPEEAVMDYLETHPTINNKEARKVAHVIADHRMKGIFNKMVDKGMIEQVPGTRTSNTAYRKASVPPPEEPAPNHKDDKLF
jgi:ATP-dependent DNA helicase RecG